MKDQPSLILRDIFENIMLNSIQPNMKIVQSLLKSMNDINMRNESGKTPLIIAAEQNQTETIQHLISLMYYNKDVNSKNSNKDTTRKVSTENVLDLVKDFININARDYNGSTALFLAAQKGIK